VTNPYEHSASTGPGPEDRPYVSRGGLKLAHALDEFGIEPAGMTCADLGSSTGGFTDCLLRRGAARVYAVDTAYGELAWTLRNDPRVVVMERTNALHANPPEQVDLIVIDLGWTRQQRAIGAAIRWTAPGARIVSLIKPHYELGGDRVARAGSQGVLRDDLAERVAHETAASLPELGVRVLALTRSPIRGGRKGRGTGNAEWLVLCEPPGD